MKYFTSLVLALSLAGIASAQVDDRYMTKDLDAPRSTVSAQNSSQMQSSDQSYIDYEDDSYSTRIRRFHRPIGISSYYGSVYSPYYFDPFYTDPFVGWGGLYQPGFNVGFGGGYGYGPYWSSCWGQTAWFGFSPFSYWNVGFGIGYGGFGGYGFNNYGYGGFNGYGYGGYWNGYYAGLYDGNYGRSYRNTVNYGPRANTRTTNYGPRQSGFGANGRSAGNVITGNRSAQVARSTNNFRLNDSRSINIDGSNLGTSRTNSNVINGNARNISGINGNSPIQNSNDARINNGARINSNSVNYQGQPSVAPRRNGFFNRNNSIDAGSSAQPGRNFNRSSAPQAPRQQNYTPAPSRNISPTPTRSFSAPSASPSRSSGGSFGGSSRGGSIRR